MTRAAARVESLVNFSTVEVVAHKISKSPQRKSEMTTLESHD